MSINFNCPKCKKSFTVKDDYSGKKAKCSCGETIDIPLEVDNPKNNQNPDSSKQSGVKVCAQCLKTISTKNCGVYIDEKILCNDCKSSYLEKKFSKMFDIAKEVFLKQKFNESLSLFKEISTDYPPLSKECQKYIDILVVKQNHEEKEINNPAVSGHGSNAIDFLIFFAWVNLIGGIIGAIVIWSTIGTIEVGYHDSVANPYGIILGIVSLAQGMLICAFLHVICLIAENIIEIRKNLEKSAAKK